MANEQNLRVPTSEQARKNGRKGGLASAKKRAERKTLKEELKLLLETIEEGQTNQEKMSVAILKQALKGNTKAFEIIRDTIGEKPTEKVEQINTDLSYEDYVKKLENEDEY